MRFDSLTLMKGDERVELLEESAYQLLLALFREGNVKLHNLILRNVEARYALRQQCDVIPDALRSQHVCEIVRVEGFILSISKTKTVQIYIWLVREPYRRHTHIFGRLR